MISKPAPALPARRPDSRTAMARLIAEIRDALPLADPGVCTGQCNGCSLKLLDYLEGELTAWEARLTAGERMGLAELSRLARTARKVQAALERNGVIATERRAPGTSGHKAGS